MPAQRSIAIVGGGWAGLAAAVELSAAGQRVTLFEAAKQLGGRARSVSLEGHRLDNGQHILIGAYRETLRLIQQVGVDPRTCLRRIPLEIKHPGAAFHLRLPHLPAPFHLALGLLLAQGASLGEKVGAARFMRALQANDYHLANDISVAELLDLYHQHGALRQRLWEPLCIAALNTAPGNASAQIFANVLRESLGGQRSDTDLLLPATDLNTLFPDAATRFIEAHGGVIRYSTRVEAIDNTLVIQGEAFDRIVIATSPHHARALLAAHSETAAVAETLASYVYEPIGCAYLGFPTTVTLPIPMLGLERRDGSPLGQWIFDRGTLCGTLGIMAFVLSANGDWDALDNTTLCAALHRELEAALEQRLPPPAWQHVIRERRATFSCRPNLPRPAAKTALKGLWLAGDYVYADYPGTLEGAVRSGVVAAQGILGSEKN